MSQDVTDKKIAELRATGHSTREIAPHVDLSYRQVARRLKREELRELVESEHLKFLKSLPNARKNIQNLIDTYTSITDENEKERAWRSSMEMLRSAGLLPSHSMSVLLQQISMTQNISLSPELLHRITQLQDIDPETGQIIDIPPSHSQFSPETITEAELIENTT